MTKYDSVQNQMDSDVNHQSSHEANGGMEKDCQVKPVNSCEQSTRGFFELCKGNSAHYEKSLQTGVLG